jgi:alcohol dehydrogenase class IV
MKAFTFQAPPNILFEAGASKKLAELVAGYGAKRVLLVTDKGVRNAGLTKNAEAGLVADGCELTVFDEVEADPPSHVIERAVALCREGDRTGRLDRWRQRARYGEAGGLSRQDP